MEGKRINRRYVRLQAAHKHHCRHTAKQNEIGSTELERLLIFRLLHEAVRHFHRKEKHRRQAKEGKHQIRRNVPRQVSIITHAVCARVKRRRLNRQPPTPNARCVIVHKPKHAPASHRLHAALQNELDIARRRATARFHVREIAKHGRDKHKESRCHAKGKDCKAPSHAVFGLVFRRHLRRRLIHLLAFAVRSRDRFFHAFRLGKRHFVRQLLSAQAENAKHQNTDHGEDRRRVDCHSHRREKPRIKHVQAVLHDMVGRNPLRVELIRKVQAAQKRACDNRIGRGITRKRKEYAAKRKQQREDKGVLITLRHFAHEQVREYEHRRCRKEYGQAKRECVFPENPHRACKNQVRKIVVVAIQNVARIVFHTAAAENILRGRHVDRFFSRKIIIRALARREARLRVASLCKLALRIPRRFDIERGN